MAWHEPPILRGSKIPTADRYPPVKRVSGRALLASQWRVLPGGGLATKISFLPFVRFIQISFVFYTQVNRVAASCA